MPSGALATRYPTTHILLLQEWSACTNLTPLPVVARSLFNHENGKQYGDMQYFARSYCSSAIRMHASVGQMGVHPCLFTDNKSSDACRDCVGRINGRFRSLFWVNTNVLAYQLPLYIKTTANPITQPLSFLGFDLKHPEELSAWQ